MTTTTIIIFGSYGELVVRVCDGAILDRSKAGPEYADIRFFVDCPNEDAQIMDMSYITDTGELSVPDTWPHEATA